MCFTVLCYVLRCKYKNMKHFILKKKGFSVYLGFSLSYDHIISNIFNFRKMKFYNPLFYNLSRTAFSNFSKFSLDLDASLQISLFYWQNACLKKKIRANQYSQDLLPIHTNTQSKQRLKTNTQKINTTPRAPQMNVCFLQITN